MPSPDQTKKELDHIFLNLFDLGPWDEEDWKEEHLIFIEILSEMALKHGIGAIVLLSHEELDKILHEVQAKANNKDANLCFYLSVKVKQLQFYLKNFQEKGLVSCDGSFDSSSINESYFRKFGMHPDGMAQISNGWHTRPIPLLSQKHISKGVSSGNINRNPSSASKRCSTLSFVSSSFCQDTT